MTRDDAEDQILGIRGNNHKAYATRLMAERAWLLANALGTVRRLDRAGVAIQIPAIAFPDEVMDAFTAFPDDFLGAEWHVVTKGRRPGIYPSWCQF